MNLANLQSQFARALCYQASGETCNVIGDRFSADEHLQIYRNNFIISLTEVLSATYPMVEALLGKECFAQIARHHVLNHPLTEGQVAHYGAGFAETIKLFDQVTARAPYASEVARFEWQIDFTRQTQAEQLLGAEVIAVTQLANIPTNQQSNLVFHLRSGCHGFESNYAVFDLFAAIQNQQFEQLDINQPQCGFILVDVSGGVACHRLDLETFQLLTCLEQKQPLGEIQPPLLGHLNPLMQLDLINGFSLQRHEWTG